MGFINSKTIILRKNSFINSKTIIPNTNMFYNCHDHKFKKNGFIMYNTTTPNTQICFQKIQDHNSQNNLVSKITRPSFQKNNDHGHDHDVDVDHDHDHDSFFTIVERSSPDILLQDRKQARDLKQKAKAGWLQL